MAIGRITGSVLKSNLTRNGTDLAFETNLLYLDVTNSRVGIGTSEPTTALQVNGTITATGLAGLTSLAVDGVTITDNTISTNSSDTNLELDASGSGKVSISGLLFPTSDGSAGQFLTTDGSGALSFATVSTNSISQLNSNVTVTDSGTGAVTVAADGATIITMNASITLDASAATNSIRLPVGTTAQRPSGSTGEIRYNSSTDAIEGYTTAGGWAQLGATTATAENTDDTAGTEASAISTSAGVIDQFTTSSFDSAWYLTITRDEINNEVATAKHSLVHNNTAAFVATSHVTESDASNAYLTATADITGGNARLLGTGGSVVNSVSTYRIALGDNTTAGTTGSVTTVINTDVDSASESIDSWAKGSYRGAKYYISVNNASKTEVSNMEALVVHDGTTAFISTYGVLNTGSNDLVSLTAAISGDNVVVSAAGNEPNLRITTYRILLSDSESGSTGDKVNGIAATNVSSTATTVDSFSNSVYTGAFYVFTGYNANGGEASASEVMVVSNDDAHISTGPIISSTGTDQLAFSVTQAGSTVTVKAASTSGASTTVNGYRVHMLRGSAGASTADTVLVSTTQTITGQKTFSEEVILNSISSDDSSAIQINDAINVSGDITTTGTVVMDRLALTSSQTTVPPLRLTANSLNDGVGALRIDGSQADIYLNPSSATHTTVTFAVNDDPRLAFGMDNNSDFYITRRTGGSWYDDTLVIDRASGELRYGYDVSITGSLTVSEEVILNTISSSDSSAVTINDNLKVTGLTTDNAFLINAGDGTIGETTTLTVDPASNYLGINQSSPEVTLHMTGEGAQTAQIRMEQYNDSADAPDVRTRRYRGTIDSPLAVNSGDYLFRSNHEYYNGTSLLVGGAFAFDNTNNANRTQFSVAVDTDGTGANPAGNSGQFIIDGNAGGRIKMNTPVALAVNSDPATITNYAHIYAKDEASSAEVFVKDEAGNVTKISPHNQEGEWEYYSRNTKTGKTVRVNMEEMIRDIEKLTGKTYIKND